MATKTQIQRMRKWIKALRSGKYAQARRTLATGGGFCCLGVACEVYKESGNAINEEKISLQTFDGVMVCTRYEESHSVLPAKVQEWYGMATCDGVLPEGQSLLNKNDKGKSFAEIADLMEQNLDALLEK